MLEHVYQARLIRQLKDRFDDCLILKNDSSYLQGIPDLSIFWGPHWGMLEVKASANAVLQPNQLYYIEWANELNFAAVIYPENEAEVLDALQQALTGGKHGPCIS